MSVYKDGNSLVVGRQKQKNDGSVQLYTVFVYSDVLTLLDNSCHSTIIIKEIHLVKELSESRVKKTFSFLKSLLHYGIYSK